MSRNSFHFSLAKVLLIVLLFVVFLVTINVDKSTTVYAQELEPFEDKTVVSLNEKVEFYLNENTIHVIEELHDRETQLLDLVKNIHNEIAARGQKAVKSDEPGFDEIFGPANELVEKYNIELASLVKVYDDLNYLQEIAEYVNDVDHSLEVLEAKSQVLSAVEDRELYKKSFYTPEYIGQMVDEYTDELDSLLNIYDGLEYLKVKAEAFRKATCFNLLKAVNKIKVNDWVPREWCVQLQLI